MAGHATPQVRREAATPQKPTAPAVEEAGIPTCLKALDRWVGWRYKARKGGRWAKLPLRCSDGRPAKVTEAADWGPFRVALDAHRRHGWDGVGFVLAASDPFSGVDLDDCRDPATGRLAAWAEDIVRRLDSYAEVSPSGTGVKVFVEGTLAGKPGRRKGGVEVYSAGRYFTVTGLRLDGTPADVRGRQLELAQLHEEVFGGPAGAATGPDLCPPDDSELIARAMRAKNGEKFARLWSGDTGGYGSGSEADAALCGMLAFWVGPDAGRIEALFNQSGLASRGKWAQREDYRRRTIGMAIAGHDGTHEPVLIRGTRSNQIHKSKQEEAGSLYTVGRGEGGGDRKSLSAEAEQLSVRLAEELAEAQGGLPDWQASFCLARRLRTLAEDAPERFERAVAAFCERTGRAFEEFWYHFLGCWGKVRLPEGQDVFAWAVEEAARSAYPLARSRGVNYGIVASIAYHLSLHTAPAPFFLPRERLAALLGLKHPMTVTRIVDLLVEDGVIACVNDDFSYVAKKAKEYRFVGVGADNAAA